MYKVLIVEDFEADRLKLKKAVNLFKENMLEIIGECETGLEALDFIEENKPDIIISDIEMPFMNGLEMAKKIKEKYNNQIKLIFCTLYNEFKYAKEAIYANSYGYILKPIETDELLGCLEQVVEDIAHENQIKDEYNHLQYTLKTFKPVMVDNLLKEILYGINSNESDIWEKVNYFEVKIKKGFFRVLHVEIDDYENIAERQSAEEKQLFSLRIHEKIKQILGECGSFPVTRIDEMHFVVIISDNDMDASGSIANQCALKIKDFIGKTNISVTISISDSSTNISEIKSLYEQCKYIMRYKFSIGKGKIISGADIPNNIGFDGIDQNALQKDVRFLLNSGSKDEIVQYLDQYINHLTGRADDNTLRNYCFLVVICVRLVLNENNLNLSEVFVDESLIWEKLQRFETIMDAGNWLKNLLIFSNEHMTKKISSKNNLIVDEIKNYVLNNIDRSIGLDDLASELHYSPNYLNYIFKQEKGQTISDFITGVKMDKARELLADVRYKVHEISTALGYNHVAYFCSVFKKITGTTPKEYRERVI